MEEYKAKDGQVILLKKFDDGRADYDGKMDAKDINAWAQSEALPLINVFSQETASKIFGTDVKTHFILIAPATSDVSGRLHYLIKLCDIGRMTV